MCSRSSPRDLEKLSETNPERAKAILALGAAGLTSQPLSRAQKKISCERIGQGM